MKMIQLPWLYSRHQEANTTINVSQHTKLVLGSWKMITTSITRKLAKRNWNTAAKKFHISMTLPTSRKQSKGQEDVFIPTWDFQLSHGWLFLVGINQHPEPQQLRNIENVIFNFPTSAFEGYQKIDGMKEELSKQQHLPQVRFQNKYY